jgi:hypothetical protein
MAGLSRQIGRQEGKGLLYAVSFAFVLIFILSCLLLGYRPIGGKRSKAREAREARVKDEVKGKKRREFERLFKKVVI